MTDENKRTVDFMKQVKQLLHDYETCPSFSMSDVMREMPEMSEGDADLFLAACLHQRQHGCLVLAAVCYQRIEQMLSFKAFDLAQHSTAMFWIDVLHYLFSSERLCCFTMLMHEESMFQMLVEYGSRSNICLLREVVRMVVYGGLVPQFKLLIYSDHERVRQVVLERCFEKSNFVSLVSINCLNRQYPRIFQGVNPDFNSIMQLVCEAGMFMDSVPSTESGWLSADFCTPIGEATYFNQPDMVRFLYSSGTVSNHEVFVLSRNPDIIERSESKTGRVGGPSNPPAERRYPRSYDTEATKEILSFLQTTASQPRSLQSLCLRAVSRQLGWGHIRKSNVEQLKIPAVMKDELNFKHSRKLLKC